MKALKKKFFIILLFGFLLLIWNSAVYADPYSLSAPLWDTKNGPSVMLSNTEIAIYWLPSASSALAGYYIYRCQGENCVLPSQPTFKVNDPSATFWGDATLNAGKYYRYTIAAYDKAGNVSHQSSVISANTTGN